jgi:branched-chain amino acid transport system permease protein
MRALVDWRAGPGLTLAAILLLALVPLFGNEYTLHVLTIGLYYTILAASWNLLAGFTGQFSLAQQTFASIGAYTSGLLVYHFGLPIPLTIASGVVLSTALGWVLGRMVLRMRAIYLAIATWAFAETIHVLLTAAFNITRGELGLNVPPLYGNLEPRAYFYTFLALATLCLAGMYAMVRSPIGTFMRAIRDDELRAESLGVDTTRVKVLVFTVTSGIAGLAGAFYAHYVSVLSPQMADFNEMAKLVIMVVVGGLGTFAGPIIAAVPLQWITTWLQKWGEWDMVVYALIVIVLMRSYTGGLAALFSHLASRAGYGRRGRAEASAGR